MSLVFLSSALVVWVADVVGSLLFATIIVGVTYLVVAIVVYFMSLHATIERISRRLDTVYEVSAAIEAAYRQVVLFVKKVMGGT
ncbi:MAG: hypothetical protein J6Q62_06785 [Alistipes sp.]|nr:hypothetical protein [Alistipes sp.]